MNAFILFTLLNSSFDFSTLIVSLVLIWIFYVFSFSLQLSKKITEKNISELAKSEIRNNIGSVKANINLYQGVRFIGRVSVVVTVADGVYRVGKLKYEYRPQTQEEYQEWLEFNDYGK